MTVMHMDPITLFFISIGLAMDCFAVSLAVGARRNIPRMRIAVLLALLFGGFQAIMNIAGWAAGEWLLPFISEFDHWIAFILLAAIGGKMIHDGMREKDGEEEVQIQGATLLLLAIATSIDSLGVGLSFALLATFILFPALIIGMVSAIFSFFGVLSGRRLTEHFGERMETLGGIILIGIGLRILMEHISA
jgi:putative Mn2+ efflux pump MntP